MERLQMEILAKLRQKHNIVTLEPINKGWSGDKKYRVETANGQRLFLRVSDIAEYERKKAEYDMMEQAYNHGVLTPKPVGLGICDDGKSCYSLSGWLDGEDLSEVWVTLSETEQYTLGLKAGEILRKIHTLPAPVNGKLWSERFYPKVQGRIDFYNTSPIKSENGDVIVRYLKENRHFLNDRPQTFNHGDYGLWNLMFTSDAQIGVIDFNAYNKDYGDPWREIAFIPCGMDKPSIHFHTGMIRGYFGGKQPFEFFELLSYYSAYGGLAALCDTYAGEYGEPEDGKRHMENILRWFDNMSNPVPSWYLSEWGAAK